MPDFGNSLTAHFTVPPSLKKIEDFLEACPLKYTAPMLMGGGNQQPLSSYMQNFHPVDASATDRRWKSISYYSLFCNPMLSSMLFWRVSCFLEMIFRGFLGLEEELAKIASLPLLLTKMSTKSKALL